MAVGDGKLDLRRKILFSPAQKAKVLENAYRQYQIGDTDLVPNDEALMIIMEIFENMVTHPIKTAEGFRNAALGNGMFAINPLLTINQKSQVNFLMGILRSTISEGRMIDFGFLPNELIKQETLRARDVFEAEELQHPYESWVGISSWEGGMCGYYYSPNFADSKQILAVEMYGVSPPGRPDTIMINDIVTLEIADKATRIMPFPMIDNQMETPKQLQDRGANLLDPLVTFLRLLADASIPIIDQPAPEKLNKRRISRGQFAIPAHTRVETQGYVSLLTARPSSSDQGHKGGHHASPVAHWRRAHQRHLQTGRVVPVRSSKVNWRETEELHRLFYRVPHA